VQKGSVPRDGGTNLMLQLNVLFVNLIGTMFGAFLWFYSGNWVASLVIAIGVVNVTLVVASAIPGGRRSYKG
jgi:hypothetical protein